MSVSAAFDTVDHQILINRLSVSFGLSGLPLDWITSFLAGRSSCVVLGTSRSPWALAPFGLPQGSAPSLHLVFLKVPSWLPYYIYSTLLILALFYLPMWY